MAPVLLFVVTPKPPPGEVVIDFDEIEKVFSGY